MKQTKECTLQYHPHHKGSVATSIIRGAAGIAIVDDDAQSEGLPSWLTDMPEQILQIHHMEFSLIPFLHLEPVRAPYQIGVDHFTRVDGNPPNLGSPRFFFVNGEHQPTICLNQNEWTRLRFGYVAATFPIVLQFLDGDCELQLLARDGVLVHGEDNTTPRQINSVRLSPASRSDVAIRCSKAGTFSFGVHGITSDFPPPGQENPAILHVDLAHLHVQAEQTSSSSSEESSELSVFHPIRPVYLQSLLSETVSQVHEDIVFAGLGGSATLQGRQFSTTEPNMLAEVPLGSVNEWTYHGILIHIAHQHVFHAQALTGFMFL